MAMNMPIALGPYLRELPAEGEQVKAYHCKQGRNNDRLYVRVQDGVVLWYCFHCGWKGRQRVGVATGTYHRGSHRPTSGTLPFPEFDSHHPRVTEYLRPYELTTQDAKEHYLGWCSKFQRVGLPISDPEGNISLVQYRKILEDDTGPKYITQSCDNPWRLFIPDFTKRGGDVLIVEDALSAIKADKVIPSIALLGTNLNKEGALYLSQHYTKVRIWLDNDNIIVKKQALKLYRLLSSLMCATLIPSTLEPKYLTYKDILTYVRDT